MSDSLLSSRSHIRFPQFDEEVGVKISSENRRVLFIDDPETQRYLRAVDGSQNWQDDLYYDYRNYETPVQMAVNSATQSSFEVSEEDKRALRSAERPIQKPMNRTSKFTKENILKKEPSKDLQQTMVYRDAKGDLFNQAARRDFEQSQQGQEESRGSYRASWENRQREQGHEAHTNEKRFFEEDWVKERNERSQKFQPKTPVNTPSTPQREVKTSLGWNPKKPHENREKPGFQRGDVRESLHRTDHRMSEKYHGRSYFVPKYIPASVVHEENRQNITNQELRQSLEKSWDSYYVLETQPETENFLQREKTEPLVRQFEEQKKIADTTETRRKYQEPANGQLGMFQTKKEDVPLISRRELREARKKGLTPYEMKKQSELLEEKPKKARLEKTLTGIMEEESTHFDTQHFTR